MPLKHPDYRDYPTDWHAFSRHIRHVRAAGRCECTGECGQHQDKRCTELNKKPARFAAGRIVLTTAHLCDCYPLCAIQSHVKAMCQKCHLRTDRYRHAASRLRTQATARLKSKRLQNRQDAIAFENLHILLTTPQSRKNRFTGLQAAHNSPSRGRGANVRASRVPYYPQMQPRARQGQYTTNRQPTAAPNTTPCVSPPPLPVPGEKCDHPGPSSVRAKP